MTTTLAAIRGKFGSTEYYIVTMPASQLKKMLVIPKEFPDWDSLTIEERFQRDINYKRVKQHIAPYLANDPDRFFGAFIVDIYNGDEIEFEDLGDVVRNIPKYYVQSVKDFGVLHLSGKEVFIPLDGQHRLAAISFAISGKDEKGKDIPGIDPSVEVGRDICTCIMIKHEKSKARKIFNKVNRYAKSTSKADNLITADDDCIAVITRENVVKEYFHERIVNFRSNTLTGAAAEFTTLATLYEANGIISESYLGLNKKIDRTVLPPQNEKRLIKDSIMKFWEVLTKEFTPINSPIQDPTETGDERRKQFRKDYILGKPIIQLALVEAIIRLASPDENDQSKSLLEICRLLREADWSVENQDWQRVLMNGEKVIVGTQARKLGARFLAYYFGEPLVAVEYDTLEGQYKELFDKKSQPLPSGFRKQ